jgi:hypothetical protein
VVDESFSAGAFNGLERASCLFIAQSKYELAVNALFRCYQKGDFCGEMNATSGVSFGGLVVTA